MKFYLFIILLVGLSYTHDANHENKNNSIPAYDFTLQILNGDNDSLFTLSSLKGNVILINFWATWCGPCIAEIPEFNNLREKYHSKNFEILGISISDSKKQLKKFTSKINVDYPILFASKGQEEGMGLVISNYGGFYSIPVSYLINRDLQIVAGYPSAIIGEYWSSLLENDIKEFLAKPIVKEHHDHEHDDEHHHH